MVPFLSVCSRILARGASGNIPAQYSLGSCGLAVTRISARHRRRGGDLPRIKAPVFAGQLSDNGPQMRLLKVATLSILGITAYAQTINYARIEILTEQYAPNQIGRAHV